MQRIEREKKQYYQKCKVQGICKIMKKKNDLIKKHNYNFSTIKCYKKEERRKKKHTKSEKLMEESRGLLIKKYNLKK